MGLILYEVTTLAEAYAAPTPKEILAKILSEDIRPLTHRFHYHIDSDLKAIIRKASAWKRDDRYKSIHDFAADIRRYLRNEEVSAHPDNIFRKIFRWCLNHAVTFLIVLLILVLTTIGTGAYNLYTAITRERNEFALHEALNSAFLRCTDAAYIFDKKLNSIEAAIELTASELEFMLNNPQQVKPETPAFFHDDLFTPGKIPDTFKEYPHMHGAYDFGHIMYRTIPGIDKEKLPLRIAKTAMFMYRFRDIMIRSPFGASVTKKNFESEYEKMLKDGVPLTLIYLGFSDGLYCTYPGKIYAPDYDPRKRSWYRDHLIPDAPENIWSTPYLNATRTSIVVTFSTRIDDQNGDLTGVVAADLDVDQLIKKLSDGMEEDESILERTFLSADGSVILTTNPRLNTIANQKFYSLENNDNINVYRYPEPKLLTQIRFFMNGYIDQGKDKAGRHIYCIFARCQSIGWYYLEKVDIDKRIRKQKVRLPL